MIVIETQLDLVNEILDGKEKTRTHYLKIIEYIKENSSDSGNSFNELLDAEHEIRHMKKLNDQRDFLLNFYILHTDLSKN